LKGEIGKENNLVKGQFFFLKKIRLKLDIKNKNNDVIKG
jgi:hypothetical protein